MDDKLGASDPYREMVNSAQNDIRPGFLGGNGDGGGAGAAKALKGAEKVASAIATKGKGVGKGAGAAAGAGKGAGGAKNALSDGMKSGAEKAENKEKSGGLYNKKGSSQNDKEEPSLKMPKGIKNVLKMASPLLILLISVIAIIALIIALPIMLIGAIDYNLMKVLGFENTIAILEKVGSFVTKEFLSKGEVPAKYFSDLAAYGVDVGQVTANGDFVKTNVYIANIEDKTDLVAAASGFSYIPDDEGELAVLYNGKVIYAEDFVAAVESDPTLYAAYTGAADLDTKYYYGDDVDKVYSEMGLSRGNFNNWDSSGSYKQDEDKYFEILNGVLDSGSDLAIGGSHKDLPCPGECVYPDESTDGGTYAEDVDGIEAPTVTGDVAEKTQDYIINWLPHTEIVNGTQKTVWLPEYSDNATQRAAEILNTAVSSNEPYLASNAFISIEEPIQRARIYGDGPVNQVMNTLTKRTEVSYQNVETGVIDTKKNAVLETKNFRAAVSDNNYDQSEAFNFGRDRIIKTTDQAGAMEEDDTIRRTTVASPGHVSSNTAMRNGKNKNKKADEGVTSKANENLDLSQAKKNSETFQSVIGGNRIIEGGSFLSNTINMQVIGAMPSDSGKIAEYHKEVEEVMARRAEAERATKSPFDISSPHTFLGSIVHNMATSILGNYATGLTALSAITSAGDTASTAVASLMGSATAANGSGEYTTMSGLGCETLKMAGSIEGDLYCTSHNTPSTEFVHYTFDDFKNSEIGGDIDDEGKPVEGSGLYEFVNYGMDRYVSVGVKNAEVCERYREDTGYEPEQSFWQKVANFFGDMDGTYNVCDVGTVKGEDKDLDLEVRKIYTGAKYSFGSDADGPNSLYSSYVMYDEVKSLLSDEQSAVSKMREEYRKKHPLDNSKAGIISRRSGLSKHEAEIALVYSDYLTMIANYNPNTRFDFTAPVVSIEKPILEYHSNEMALELYAWYSKQTEYDDLRTRNFVV